MCCLNFSAWHVQSQMIGCHSRRHLIIYSLPNYEAGQYGFCLYIWHAGGITVTLNPPFGLKACENCGILLWLWWLSCFTRAHYVWDSGFPSPARELGELVSWPVCFSELFSCLRISFVISDYSPFSAFTIGTAAHFLACSSGHHIKLPELSLLPFFLSFLPCL